LTYFFSRRKLLFLLLTIAIYQIGHLPVQAEQKVMRFNRLSVSEGLSQNTVKCLLQDRFGFLWIGTNNGLNRYDGYDFQKFFHDPDDTTSLTDNSINVLYELPDDKILVGTRAGGLCLLDNKTHRFIPVELSIDSLNSSSLKSVFRIAPDKSGNLWILHTNGLVKSRWRDGKPVFQKNYLFEHPASSNYFQVLTIDSLGRPWMIVNRRLMRLDTTSGKFFEYQVEAPNTFKSDLFNFIQTDHEGRLWISHTNILNETRIYEYDYTADKFEFAAMTRYHVWGMMIYEGKRLLYGANGFGFFYPEETLDKVFMPVEHDAEYPMICSILLNDQTLWFGTYGYGLYKYSPLRNRFKTFPPKASITHRGSSVRSILEDVDGKIWLSTYDGLQIIDLEKNISTFLDLRQQLGYKMLPTFFKIYADPKYPGEVYWLGSEGRELVRYNHRTGNVRLYSQYEKTKDIDIGRVYTSILRTSDGNLWFTTFSGVSKLNEDTGEMLTFTNNPTDTTSLSNNECNFIYEDSKKRLWVGTANGLNRFDDTRQHFIRYMYQPEKPGGLKVRNIYGMLESENGANAGTLWLATAGGGLVKMIEKAEGKFDFKHYTMDDGLSDNVVYGILEDANGNLWMSSNHGLSVFLTPSETFKNFDVENGLQDNEFNRNAYYKSDRGEMFFGGVNGLNYFKPEEILFFDFDPPVYLTDVVLFEQKPKFKIVPHVLDELTLDYFNNDFSVKFAALDYNITSSIKYAYKIDELYKDWIELGKNRTITLSNMDPGNYTLLIRATNSDGLWSNKHLLGLDIYITPPFWETWWFQYLMVLILFGVIAQIMRWRTKNIVARNLELEKAIEEKLREIKKINEQLLLQEKLANLGKLTTVVSHEIRNPLGTIRNSIYSLNEMINAKSPTIRRELERAERNIQRCDRIINELLEYSRIPKIYPVATDIDALIKDVLADMTIPENISVVLQLASPNPIIADSERIRRCVINLISNAVEAINEDLSDDKPKQIVLSTHQTRDETIISVQDSGSGIPEELRGKIFEPLFSTKGFGVGMGLAILQQTVGMHSGKITVVTRENKGTTISITLPNKPDFASCNRQGVLAKVEWK
jgi:signal transduction histidine kinase/ligand-binding sensor domain-containing protein